MTEFAAAAEKARLEALSAAGEAQTAAADAVEAKERARELAERAAELDEAAFRAEWIRVQIEEHGLTLKDLDVERGLVRSLPIGPTYGAGGPGWTEVSDG